MKRATLMTAALVLMLGGVGKAKGGIIATTGEVNVIAPPPSVQLGAVESNTQIPTFAERVRFSLPTSVAVDITAAGTYANNPTLTPGTIGAGTLVDSYYMYSDPIDSNSIMFDGSATFNTNILGVIVLNNTLNGSDPILGAPGTLYPTGLSARGMELTPGEDSVTISADLRTLTFHGSTDTSQDTVRIITAASPVSGVPEPSSLALFGIAAASLAGYSRWKRRKQAQLVTA
jgi:hypothetical protein